MLNRVVLTGRLTRDPELRYTQSGVAVLRFSIAVDRQFRNRQTGEREADFINCVIWRRSAENFANFTHKGALVGIDGRLSTSNYENQQGQRVYRTEVDVDNFALLEPRSSRDAQPAGGNNRYGNGNQSQGGYNNGGYGQGGSYGNGQGRSQGQSYGNRYGNDGSAYGNAPQSGFGGNSTGGFQNQSAVFDPAASQIDTESLPFDKGGDDQPTAGDGTVDINDSTAMKKPQSADSEKSGAGESSAADSGAMPSSDDLPF